MSPRDVFDVVAAVVIVPVTAVALFRPGWPGRPLILLTQGTLLGWVCGGTIIRAAVGGV